MPDETAGTGMPDAVIPLPESAEEIAAWWTPERRAQARPKVHVPPESAGTAVGEPAAGPVRIVLGEAPALDPGRREPAPGPAADEPREVGDPPREVTRAEIDFPPYAKIGQLFFEHGGQPWTGSAFVVGLNLVLTAAHNLWDQGAYSSKFSFMPAAWDRTGAFGSWSPSSLALPGGYEQGQPTSLDYGVLQMRVGGNHATSVGSAVGTLGYRTGADPTGQRWADVGYPGNFGNARRMYAQVGSFAAWLDGNTVVAMTGDFTQGASGGPWLLQEGAGATVNGLHSGRRPGRDGEVLSPFFGQAVYDFLQRNGRASAPLEASAPRSALG